MSDTTSNPWKTKSLHTVHETPWIKIVHHDVVNPAGNPAIYTTVEFKNLAIGIIPIDEEGYTWLVGQYRFPINQYSWEIVEGGSPLNEDPLNTAKRELKEESGIVAKDFKEIYRMHLSNSATNELAIIYVAQNLSFENSEPEESEVLQVKKIHILEAEQLVYQNKITDAISVVGLILAAKLYNEGKL
jgi:8-oxo-dGTP pyrophosphatase MutT (NUDIX family)